VGERGGGIGRLGGNGHGGGRDAKYKSNAKSLRTTKGGEINSSWTGKNGEVGDGQKTEKRKCRGEWFRGFPGTP